MVLEQIKQGVMGFGWLAIFGGAIAIAVTSFQGTLSSGTAAYNITNFGLQGMQNALSYLGTSGTLLGVGALVAIVGTAFYWAAK